MIATQAKTQIKTPSGLPLTAISAAIAPKIAGIKAPKIGDVKIDFQNNLDMLLPRLLPAVIVLAVYWLLGKKNMTSTKAIFIVLFVSIALSALGVISK